ncbi:hypothetical protein KR067_011516, partial [Drosophila pandora]
EKETIYKEFKKLRKTLDACARFVGYEVTIPTFKMNWRSYAIIAISVVFVMGTFYTIYEGLFIGGDWMVLLQCTCQAGAGFQSIAKLIFYIKDRRFLWEILDILDATYEHERCGEHYKRCLQEDFQHIKLWMKGFGILYCIVVLLCVLFPLIYYILYKKKLLMMTFLVPGMNPDTTYGYSLLTSFHFGCMVCGGVGNYAADMYLLFFISSAPVSKNILRCKLQDLDVKLDAFKSHNQISSQEIREDMVKIVTWHQKYLRVLECSERVFFVIIFVEIVTCCVSNLSLMYCILRGDWPSGKVFIFYSISTFMMYCTLGTIVDNSNLDFMDIVYNFRWYDLPLSEQRTMLFLLRRSQATSGLSVGKMMPLNMQTALQLSKSTYTVLMILLRGKET